MSNAPTSRPPAAPPPVPRSRLKSPWVIRSAVLLAVLGCGLLAGWLLFAGRSWDPEPLRSYLPPDARNVRTGGSTTFLTTEGVCAFSSSPAELDKLASSPGFADITSEVASPAGKRWRAKLDRVARRHLGQTLDSLGTVTLYQKTLREELGESEDVVVVLNEPRDKAMLFYLYQQ